MIDLWTSRRDFFLKCEYWSQNEDENYVSNMEIVHNDMPTGTFRAKEVNSFVVSNGIIGSSFMYEENNVTIETRYDVSDLKRNDLVRIEEKFYRVDSIQKAYVKKQRQFHKGKTSASYFISLRG